MAEPLFTPKTASKVASHCVSLPGGGQAYIYGVNKFDDIFARPVDGSGVWRHIPGKLKHVSGSGKSEIFGVNGADDIFRCQKPCIGEWEVVNLLKVTRDMDPLAIARLFTLKDGISAVYSPDVAISACSHMLQKSRNMFPASTAISRTFEYVVSAINSPYFLISSINLLKQTINLHPVFFPLQGRTHLKIWCAAFTPHR